MKNLCQRSVRGVVTANIRGLREGRCGDWRNRRTDIPSVTVTFASRDRARDRQGGERMATIDATRPAPRQVVLVTGFEPYGGRGINPAAEVAKRRNGLAVDRGVAVGQTLPVSFRGLREHMAAVLGEIDPVAILSLGLWPGEPVIRLERVAQNLAAFEIPDNEGLV